MLKPTKLNRKHFETSRELDYLSTKELTAQTGHRPEEWPLVVLKELVDNSLDACEESGALPAVEVTVSADGITVEDNGPGIPESVVVGTLDFSSRISSREAYVSPDRGAQGNALKTLVAMPFTLYGRGRVEIEACGKLHVIAVSVNQVTHEPKINHSATDSPKISGTRFFVEFEHDKPSLDEVDDFRFLQFDDREDAEDSEFENKKEGFILGNAKAHFLQLADSFCWINPHLTMTVDWFGERSTTNRTVDSWKKWGPSNPTDPHWYSLETFKRLIAANISHDTKTVRELVTEFRGLSSSAKARKVLESSGLARVDLVDLVEDHKFNQEKIVKLLAAMKEHTKPVKPKSLGVIGVNHLKNRCELLGGDMESFSYSKVEKFTDEGHPFIIETAFCYCPELTERRMVTGVNWSPGIVNPFRQLGEFGRSLDSVLNRQYSGEDEPIAFLLHVSCPMVRYADRGKSAVVMED